MSAGPNPTKYVIAVLHGIGAPVTQANVKAMLAWGRAEGGTARWNWMNTTQPAHGASDYNSVGVKNYGSFQQGVQATVQTLRNGHYGAILAALHRGNNPMAVATAVGSSPWGTSGTLMASVLHGMGAIPIPKGSGGSLPAVPNGNLSVPQTQQQAPTLSFPQLPTVTPQFSSPALTPTQALASVLPTLPAAQPTQIAPPTVLPGMARVQSLHNSLLKATGA